MRWLLTVAGAATLGLLVTSVWSQTEAAASPGGCTLYWTGATDSRWTDPTNWSVTANGTGPVRTPVYTDVVCMSAQATRTRVEYVSLTRAVAGIDFGVAGSQRPQLVISGGVLTVGTSGGSFDSVINDLQLLSGGGLRGTADHLLTGSPSLTDNAVLAGSGVTTLGPATTVTTNGLILEQGRRLVVQGTLTHNGCYDYLYLYGGAVLENDGLVAAASSCGNLVYSDGSTGSKVINNAGATFRITQPAGDTYALEAPLVNLGVVAVPQGSIVVRPMSSSAGSYDLGSGGRLYVASGGTLQVGAGTLSGARNVVVNGGRLDVIGAVSLDVLEIRSGQVTGDITTQTLTTQPGAVVSGSSVVTVGPGGTAAAPGLLLEDGSRLINRGTMSGIGCAEPFRLEDGSVLENQGTWSISCAGAIETDGSTAATVLNGSGGRITVALATVTSVYDVPTKLTNNGRVDVTKGKLQLSRLSNFASGVLTGGTYSVTGGTLGVPGGIITNAATITLASPGEIVGADGTRALLQLRTNTGTLTLSQGLEFNHPLTNAGTITVNAYALKPSTYTQTAGRTTVASGASVVGSAASPAVTINGGVVTGAGRVGNIAGTGITRPARVLTVNSGYTPAPTATLDIPVNSAADGGLLAVQGNATLSGTLTITTAAGFTPARGTAYTVLTTARRTGTFSSVLGQNLPGGSFYDVSYTNTAVTLTVRALPLVGASDGVAAVGGAGGTPMTFLVSLDRASSQAVSVGYRTADETAVAGADYVPRSGVLVFPPGVAELPIVVSIAVDPAAEPLETFWLMLEDPVNAQLTRVAAIGWITHEDGAPTAPTISGVTPDRLGQGANRVERTIGGSNFVPSSVVTIAGTEVRLDDTRYVDADTLVVTVSTWPATTLGQNDVVVTNPGLGTATCEGCLLVTERPQPADDDLWLATGASARTVTVIGTDFQPGSVVTVTGGSGVSPTSQFVSSSQIALTLQVAETATRGSWSLRVTNPDGGVGVCTGCFEIVAGPTVTGLSPSTVTRGSSTAVTLSGTGFVAGASILPPPGVSFTDVEVISSTRVQATMSVDAGRAKGDGLALTVVNAAGGGYGSIRCSCLDIATMVGAADVEISVGVQGPVELVFDIRLDATSVTETSVSYATVDGEATAGTDYVAVSGTAVFAPGTLSQPVRVTVLPDTGTGPDETFALALGDPAGAVLSTTAATATIRHDATAVALPVLNSVTPQTVGANASGRLVTLVGERFDPSSVVAVAGTGVTVATTTYVDASTLRVTLSVRSTAAVGPRDVTVTTPGAGSSTCPACVRVTPAPAPADATPELGAGAIEQTVTVSGTGFEPGANPSFPGGSGVNVLSTEFVSGTTLRLTITVGKAATVGVYDIRVTNPDGGTTLCSGCYRIQAGPNVLAMTPPVLVRGLTVPVVITGTGFAPGATVEGPDGVEFRNVVVVDSTTMTALVSVSLTRPRGVSLPITVMNSVAGGYGQGTCWCLGISL